MKNDEFNERVGARIAEKRKELGIGKSELGSRIGKKYLMVHRYENGLESVTLPVLEKLCEAFGCSASELLGF